MKEQDGIHDKILLTRIQRFSLHDGPGIRTTVFLKGCSLRCPWCCNPENIKPEIEEYIKDGVKGIYGKYASWKEIYEEIQKDRIFYDVGESGGVTFSGGEPLLQAERLEPLLACLQKDQIHIAVETSLFAPRNKLEIILKYINLFYVDIKILEPQICRTVLHGDLEQYYQNLDILFQHNTNVIFRIPVIGGYTTDDKNINLILSLLKRYPPSTVEILKEHHLGFTKYQSLGLELPHLTGVEDHLLEKYKERIKNCNIRVDILKV